MQRRFVIAGTSSGAGKTTITLGLLAAFKKKGYVVQGFKCGPDYIDPSYHTAVTGRKSRNIDTWMLSHDVATDVFIEGSEGADLSIIEGVMGFYDGKRPETNEGSTAEISLLLQAPVILVVNIGSMARSAAAIVKGYQLLDPSVHIAGVIVNQAGSVGHYELCKKAIEQECKIPVIGYLKKGDVPSIPARHLGLIPAIERGELNSFFEQLGEVIGEQVNLEALLQMTEHVPTLTRKTELFSRKEEKAEVTIAVAYDSAFNFYYQENLKLLQLAGAQLRFFSPLAGEVIPENADGLYIGGGFPEEFAEELAENKELKEQLASFIKDGFPVFAECGGYMYLTKGITTTDNKSFPMVGVIPGSVKMGKKLAALGYREITSLHESIILPKGEKARGHEFHYSTFEQTDDYERAYFLKGLRKSGEEGFHLPNVTGGYAHIHFASNPTIPQNFVKACKQYSNRLLKKE